MRVANPRYRPFLGALFLRVLTRQFVPLSSVWSDPPQQQAISQRFCRVHCVPPKVKLFLLWLSVPPHPRQIPGVLPPLFHSPHPPRNEMILYQPMWMRSHPTQPSAISPRLSRVLSIPLCAMPSILIPSRQIAMFLQTGWSPK